MWDFSPLKNLGLSWYVFTTGRYMVDYEGVQQKTEFVPQTSAISSVSLCNEYVVCTKINKQIKYL